MLAIVERELVRVGREEVVRAVWRGEGEGMVCWFVLTGDEGMLIFFG